MTNFPKSPGEKDADYTARLARWSQIAQVIETRYPRTHFCTSDIGTWVPFRVTGNTLFAMAAVGYLVVHSPAPTNESGRRIKWGQWSGAMFMLASSAPKKDTPAESPHVEAVEPVSDGIEADARRWAVYGRSAAVTRLCREYGMGYRTAAKIVEGAVQ